MFDDNEGLLHQVVLGITSPALCDPGIKDIAQDRELVAILLVRHFKKFGGLVLPPIKQAREAQEAYERVLSESLAAGRQPVPMRYPNWRVLGIIHAVTVEASDNVGSGFRQQFRLQDLVVALPGAAHLPVDVEVATPVGADVVAVTERKMHDYSLSLSPRAITMTVRKEKMGAPTITTLSLLIAE